MLSLNRNIRTLAAATCFAILLYYLSSKLPTHTTSRLSRTAVPTLEVIDNPSIQTTLHGDVATATWSSKLDDKSHGTPVPSQSSISVEAQKSRTDEQFRLPQQTHPSTATSNLPPLAKGELVMVTASSGNHGFLGIPDLKDMVYENRMTYAHKWGYEFMWANISSYDWGAQVYWNKIPILQDALKRYPKAKWIWWMDIDIIIMNMGLDMYTHLLSPEGMRKHIQLDKDIRKPGGNSSGWRTPAVMEPEDVNFLIASGGWGMNVGNFLMRRSEWTDWTLDMWKEPLYVKANWIFPENDAWTQLYRYHKIVQDHTGCTDQNALNPYPSYNSLGSHWKEGDPFIHFAGCGARPICKDHWQDYWKKRIPYEVPTWILQQLKNGTAHIEDTQRDKPSPLSELWRNGEDF